MAWVMLALMLSGIVYMIAIVSEYKTYTTEIQPRIARSEKQADRLGSGADKESSLRDQIRERTQDLKNQVGEVKLTITDAQKRIADLEKREEELEMDNYKTQFKKSKRSV